jgi:hypothetical protein
MLVDHIIYAAPRLEEAVDAIEEQFGVRAAGGGQHPGQGTHNKLLSLDDGIYLELIGPDPAQPDPPQPRPYGVDGITRAGLVGWAIRADDIDVALARAHAAGVDLGEVIEGSRRTGDGALLRWRVTSNARTAGVIPFLISWGDTPHPATSAPSGLSLDALCVEHPDPTAIAETLRILDVDVEVCSGPRARLIATVRGPNGSGELR